MMDQPVTNQAAALDRLDRVDTQRGRVTPDAKPMLLVTLCLLSLIVGIVTGLGAVVFRDLIGFVHNVLFLGHFSFHYDASLFTPPAPWGALVILVPVIGAIGVTFLVNNFAPEAQGHGVPEVMDAIYYKRGVIRPVVAVVKSLASALAIGSGAAVGPRGTDHPDRLGARLDLRPGASACRRASASSWSPPAPAPASPRPSTRRSAA